MGMTKGAVVECEEHIGASKVPPDIFVVVLNVTLWNSGILRLNVRDEQIESDDSSEFKRPGDW